MLLINQNRNQEVKLSLHLHLHLDKPAFQKKPANRAVTECAQALYFSVIAAKTPNTMTPNII